MEHGYGDGHGDGGPVERWEPGILHARGAVFDAAGEALDRLLGEVGVPVPAGRIWLQAWASCRPDQQPWLIAVGGGGGRLEAAATLAVSRRRGLTLVTSLGSGHSDHARLPATSPDAARRLARALAQGLRQLRGPWHLSLEQLPHDDPVAVQLAGLLPTARLVAGDDLPYLDIPEGQPPAQYAPKRFRQQTRAAARRFAAAGVTTTQITTRDPHQIAALLPVLRQVRQDRDHALGRISELDDETTHLCWQTTALALAAHGHLEATVLHADGDVAAYCLGLLDGDTYRLWDGRFSPRWAAQWPGQLLYGQLLEQIVAQGTWRRVDFMRGATPFKHRLTQSALRCDHLRAASSPAVLAAVTAPVTARAAARRLRERSPLVGRAWSRVKQRRIAALPGPAQTELPARRC